MWDWDYIDWDYTFKEVMEVDHIIYSDEGVDYVIDPHLLHWGLVYAQG